MRSARRTGRAYPPAGLLMNTAIASASSAYWPRPLKTGRRCERCASSLRARSPRRQRPGPFPDRSSVGTPFIDLGERQLATGNGPVIGPERPGGVAVPPAEAVLPVAADAIAAQRLHLNRRVDVDRAALHVVLIRYA